MGPLMSSATAWVCHTPNSANIKDKDIVCTKLMDVRILGSPSIQALPNLRHCRLHCNGTANGPWLSHWYERRGEFGGLVSQFSRNLLPGILNQGCELPQPHDRHAHRWPRDAQCRVHSPGMVPDGCGDTANMRLVLFQIAGVTVPSNFLQVHLQLLQTANRIGRFAFE